MAYTADKPPLPETAEQLRARIPGWGADLDPADRHAVSRERFDPAASGAHWDFPDRQEERWPRERSIEHGTLPPVFGTTCPPKGLSGLIRRYSYRRYSEARAAHWLLLIAADRVDAIEAHLHSFVTAHPDNPITETGVLTEPAHHPIASRRGPRVDRAHLWLDPIIVAGPWVATASVVVLGIRALRRSRPSARTAGGLSLSMPRQRQ
jgi:hypothetical protein